MAKKPPKKLSFWQKYATERNAIIFFIVLFIGSIAGLVYLNHQSTANAKYVKDIARYKYLESRMQTVMDSVVLNAGQPYELNHQQGCGHTSQEWGKGQLTCSNAYVFDYEVDSEQSAAELTEKIATLLKGLAKDQDMDTYTRATMLSGAVLDFAEKEQFGCTLVYNAFTSKFHNEVLGENYNKPTSSKFVAEYSYDCGGVVTKPIYKVTD